ncbi:MAG: hypothetical protein A2Z91_04310 [Deltaproteobacteria bacterium GWA2_38_16]|nr:MAG: hypothetical protein A2Z91_04310 [Deltaproteobacteria bacterium GWA2_38_16]OGQ01774.1 MAG: hypothetical protein A3D19_07870 [Deltaproteobacteria bacterium RIFCSPHIGHO2_02_FULL_38_15]OGQ34589.1 MAG: hypothetical protein A3A72_03885 [Deltaproteobacteria bacterium RIFCSPLOWO2_01_FULL_38_9]HBQ21421.1 DNA replication/repair protein RecF [Deltaproteobacteria bacterium]
MRLSQLSLTHFRNYEKEFLEFTQETNVFFGSNAQGKTNILEAIYLLATLQTFRQTHTKELIQWEHSESILEGTFCHDDIEQKFSLLITEESKKPRINDKMVKNIADYFGAINVICFCPLDLQILQGSPRGRRRYLDQALFNVVPSYGVDIGHYYRALLQKNAALRLDQWEMADIWGEKLLVLGAKILLKRLQFIAKLNTLTSCLYREISGANEEIILHYETEVNTSNIDNLSEFLLLDLLREKQKGLLNQERRMKRALVGPHRDDFSIFIKEKDLKAFGSQGEQRTAILALKLSELLVLEKEKGVKPIFLLDDISSELDNQRKSFLFQALREKNTQVFVTTTDVKSIYMDKKESSVFKVEKGKACLLK